MDPRPHNETISLHVGCTLYPPAALGQGFTALEDKVATAIHQVGLTCQDLGHLHNALGEYRSMTLDMGVEVKVPDFMCSASTTEKMLPPWMFVTQGLEDEIVGNSSDDEHSLNRGRIPDPNRKDALLQNAFTIGGVHHLLSSVSKDTAAALHGFDKFFGMLQEEEKWLGRSGRRERDFATCLLGTPFADQTKSFNRFSISLYKPRWLNVVAFCKASQEPSSILRRTFSPSSYNAGSSDGNEKDKDNQFNATVLRGILDDRWYHAYKLMVIKVDTVVLQLDRWFDQCPCHGHLFVGKRFGKDRRKRFLEEAGLSHGRCPFVSCRGWELIVGALDQVFAELRGMCLADLLQHLGAKEVPEDVVARMLPEFHLALNHIELMLSVKFGWLKEFPYALLGLSHPLRTKAQAWGRTLVQRYDQQPEALHELAHRLTKKFLGAGVLRSQLDKFIAEGVLENELATEIATMRFIPFSDRVIEAEHVYLTAVARNEAGTFRGVRYSAAHRFKMIGDRLHNPDFRHALVTHMAEFARSQYDPRVLIRALGMENHPVFHDFCSKGVLTRSQWGLKDRYEVRRQFENIIYRQDVALKHVPHREARAEHDGAEKIAKAAYRKLFHGFNDTRSKPTSVSSLLLNSAMPHCLKVASDFVFFSLPLVSGELPLNSVPLSDAMSSENQIKSEEIVDPPPDIADNRLGDSGEPAVDEVQIEDRAVGAAIVPMDVGAAAENLGEQSRAFLRVLSGRIGEVKALANFTTGSGIPLPKRAVAFTMHRGHNSDSGVDVEICASPVGAVV